MSIEMKADLRLLETEPHESQAEHPKPERKQRLQGLPVEFRNPEPWSEPVDGAVVLTNIAEAIQRHMAIRDVDSYAVALWCAHTHVFNVFSHTPRLAITAPAPECGKTVLLTGLVANLVPKPLEVDNISPAPFFRLAASQQPTFLIDEVDAWLKEDSQLPGALNGGWEAKGRVLRCVGDQNDVHGFPTHTPVAMAGIHLGKKLSDATLSRCIVVELERALPGEIEEYYNQRKHCKPLITLNRQLARWCADNRSTLAESDPPLPPGVLNRRADKWRPLFAVAQTAGGLWTELVNRALLAEERGNTHTREMQLLKDVSELLEKGDYDPGIFTEELIMGLSRLPESNWADYNFRGGNPEDKRIKPRQLATLLDGFKCRPEAIRRGDERRKGYKTKLLKAAAKRYLPAEYLESSVTT